MLILWHWLAWDTFPGSGAWFFSYGVKKFIFPELDYCYGINIVSMAFSTDAHLLPIELPEMMSLTSRWKFYFYDEVDSFSMLFNN